ncbi:MAG: hypothetical protein AAB719_00050 [Patescibacteria group bacterium]
MPIYRRKKPEKQNGNEIVSKSECTWGMIVWVGTENQTVERLERVCTGNMLDNKPELVTMDEFRILRKPNLRNKRHERRERRKGREPREPLYSRTGIFASKVPEEQHSPDEVTPFPQSAMGATA